MWNLEGQRVMGDYYGTPVIGTVVDSRVKYGGKVQHTVELEQATNLRWRQELVTRVLLDNDEVFKVA